MPKKVIERKIQSSTAILDDPNYIIFHNWKQKAKVKWRFFRND